MLADADIPRFGGMGDHHFPITTDSDAAQAYFNQGLMFIYGFNRFEAVRPFEEAIQHDPACAMCHWGVALAFGPHINAPMMPDAVEPAHAATPIGRAGQDFRIELTRTGDSPAPFGE